MSIFASRREKRDLIDKCDALYVWHKDVIYNMALAAVGGDRDMALGIVEECMITAYNHIDKFRDEKSEESKSKIIAIYNGVLNRIFSEVQQKMGLREDYKGVSASEKDRLDTDQVLIRNEVTAGLVKYVDKLRNDEKEWIFLRFYMGLTNEELSNHFGVTLEETEKKIFFIKHKIARMMLER